MDLMEKIDARIQENFAKGKSAQYLAGWLVGMFQKRIKDIESANRVGNYGQINGVISSTMNDLKAIKAQMDHIAKTGSE